MAGGTGPLTPAGAALLVAVEVPVLAASMWTDAYVSDGEALMGKRLNGALSAMAGADIVYGAGGHYLKQKHTLRHYRDAVRPDLFVSEPLDVWQEAGGKDLIERAAEKYRALHGTLAPLDLPDDVRRDMDDIVRRADAALAG